MVHDDPTADGWLPLATAAERLGVSKHAARRRIQRGELPARQVRTRYGLAWEVRLEGDREACATVARDSRKGAATLAPDSRDPHATLAEPSDLGELVALVRELQAKAEAAAMWQARALLLAERLAAAESRLLALAAPQQPPEAPGATEPPDLTNRCPGAVVAPLAAGGLRVKGA